MLTNEIAKKAQVHPNTVRLYEQWQFISPVPRRPNGYRVYYDIHLKQMYIARLAFKQEFIQNNLRKMATKIVRLSGQEKFQDSLQAAHHYFYFLQSEYTYAKKAVHMANTLLQHTNSSNKIYTHKEVSTNLQVTEDTIRNWERNGLFTVKRNAQNRRQYSEEDIQKLLIIRTLRSAHFSITSILHLFEEIKEVEQVADIHTLLNTLKFKHEFYHVTDELELNLKRAVTDVQSIIAILEQLQ
ncbi:MerR family transcriptional regulator [Paenisporosarcina antarctica]|uniref:MerR family transcriptional regulator n=1 Tax=Paenisporosarcina antarctica TaxID=417367 RepID=A0A4P6ZXI0_9BACL|nr:MerR family transcriptional regulator [Paenisporosarcina antarctica]QBP40974.1 MerR family transcriptional regulator [Paenisporosarcina antarctica]